MKRKEENRSIIEPSCTFFKPNKINCLPSNRVFDRKPLNDSKFKNINLLFTTQYKLFTYQVLSWHIHDCYSVIVVQVLLRKIIWSMQQVWLLWSFATDCHRLASTKLFSLAKPVQQWPNNNHECVMTKPGM
jgi:hypothetical protein